MVLKKKRTHTKDVLFIDASQHYEKVKTQNVLRTEDIDKIISTYENRINEDKYSCVVAIDRDAIHRDSISIAENDYNLNIPRYVDTFEEEDQIDIVSIANEIKSLENQIKDTDSKIADFCKQLNIITPF